MTTAKRKSPATPRHAVSFAAAPRRFDARSVGAFVPSLTAKAFAKYGFSAATLLTDWAVIVGADLARCATPERLKWPRSPEIDFEGSPGGTKGNPAATLILAVDPARALDVQYGVRTIMERINAYFGYRAVTQIKIVQSHGQAPVALAPAHANVRPRPSPPVDTVSDPALRAALARMAHAIVMRKPA